MHSKPLSRLKLRVRQSLVRIMADALFLAKAKADGNWGLPAELSLTALPGTPYSRYALPMEYMPSRDYRPRWGEEGNHPPIPMLMQWFAEYAEDYRNILADMTASREALASIALDYDPAMVPEPAWRGIALNPIDSAAIYAIVQRSKPRRYMEIGSGASTSFAYRAIRDAGLNTTIISIDPEPRSEIDAICDSVIRDGLETCDVSIFDQLEADDILFLDGSHRAFMNSDVTVFFIDVLPRIKPGVIIHVHDILLPWDYPDSFKCWSLE